MSGSPQATATPVGSSTEPELRNLAIVAHVDHGKTTLVDAMLRTTGATSARGEQVDRVMDSNDQERERGITIFAKQASIRWGHYKLNIVDTPGHADFGGEVERGLAIVDGILLLVDAAEGPLPQTRYVLSKALARQLPVVVVINKVDRQDARPAEVLNEIEHLFLDLTEAAGLHLDHLDFPIVSAIAREGRSVSGVGMPSAADDLTALFEAIVKTIPAPNGDPDAPLQAIVNNLDASEYLGRLGVGRVQAGTLRKADQIALEELAFGRGVEILAKREHGRADELLGGGPVVDALEVDAQISTRRLGDLFDLQLTLRPIFEPELQPLDLEQDLARRIERLHHDLAIEAVRAGDVPELERLAHAPVTSGTGSTVPSARAFRRSSRISSRAFSPFFWAAAATTVRSAFTVRPSRPMTLPTSSGATFNS